jgi:F-type H+-transporting ATPase subunit gamma
MANKRVLVKRRKSVRNIRKITRTMQLIATARFQSALHRAIAARPYTEKLSELVSDLSGEARSVEHRLMQAREDVQRSALVIITSNRGLCGGYNANVLRTAIGHIEEQRARGIETDIYMVGKKGVLYFRFLGRRMAERITHIGDRPKFTDVEPIANMLMGRFEEGGIAAVHVAYMKFLSVGRQKSVAHRLLPLARESSEEGAPSGGASRADFEFSPEPKALLDELLPAAVRVQLFQCFTDAAVSEQIARMVAMKAATDAAGDMITALTRKYNRARQTQITLELLDIVGGANALA